MGMTLQPVRPVAISRSAIALAAPVCMTTMPSEMIVPMMMTISHGTCCWTSLKLMRSRPGSIMRANAMMVTIVGSRTGTKLDTTQAMSVRMMTTPALTSKPSISFAAAASSRISVRKRSSMGSGLKARVRKNHAMGTMTAAMGNPMAIHSRKETPVPVACSMVEMARMLKLPPTGVAIPPMTAATGMPIMRHLPRLE